MKKLDSILFLLLLSIPLMVDAQTGVEVISLRDAHSKTFQVGPDKFVKKQNVGAVNYLKNGSWIPLSSGVHSPSPEIVEIEDTDLPISLDLNTGSLELTLDHSGGKLSGYSTNEFVQFDELMNEVHTTLIGQEPSEFNQGKYYAESDFGGIEAKIAHKLDYWQTETDLELASLPNLKKRTAFVGWRTKLSIPDTWEIVTSSGASSAQGWQGALQVVDHIGNAKAMIHPAMIYDAKMSSAQEFASKTTSAIEFEKSNGQGSDHPILGSYQIIELSPGEFELTVVFERTWLASQQREWPVTVDPVITNVYGPAMAICQWTNTSTAAMTVVLPANSTVHACASAATTRTFFFAVATYTRFMGPNGTDGWYSCGAITGNCIALGTDPTIADGFYATGLVDFTIECTHTGFYGCTFLAHLRPNSWEQSVTYTAPAFVPMHYRSITDGNWTTISTWESSIDGVTWGPAATFPIVADHAITISHNIILDISLAIDETTVTSFGGIDIQNYSVLAVLDGSGTDLDVFGRIISTGFVVNLGQTIINAEALLRYTLNGGILPVVTWMDGSILEVTGISTANYLQNFNQDFGNIVWDNSGQVVEFPLLETLSSVNTFTVRNTGTQALAPGIDGIQLTDVDIESNGVLELSSGVTVDVAGDWNNRGQANIGDGSIRGNASGNQMIAGLTSFFTLENTSSSTFTFAANQEIRANLSLQGGVNHGSMQLTFNGAIVQQIDAGGSQKNLFDVELDNANGLELLNGTVGIEGSVFPTNGTLTTSGNLTIISNVSGTGRIFTISATADVVGDVTSQRYIPAGATNWRQLSSSIAGQSLANWNDDFVTAGFPGSNYPTFSFTSILSYNETVGGPKGNGWVEPSSISETADATKGYYVWCGDFQNSTSSFVVDQVGTINKGTYAPSLTLTSSAGLNEDGWNMVGNPYPCEIDWTSLAKSGLDDFYWIFDPQSGNFDVWDEPDQLGLNKADGNLASSQAFWVHAFAAPTMTIDETDKTTSGAEIFKSAASDYLKLKISSSINGFHDYLLLADRPGTSTGLDANDAVKLFGFTVDAPTLCFHVDGELLAINKFELSASDSIQIPIAPAVGVSGVYTISNTHLKGTLASECWQLHDVELDSMIAISESDYSFFISDTSAYDRFVLIGTGMPGELIAVSPNCHGGSDGQVTYDNVLTEQLIFTWTSSVGDTLLVQNCMCDGAIDSLSAGQYHLSISGFTSGCSTYGSAVELEEPIQVLPDFSISNMLPEVGESISILANTPSVFYFWDLGDGASAMGNPINHQYGAAGVYDVQLNVLSSAGCEDSVVHQVQVESPLSTNDVGQIGGITIFKTRGSIVVQSDADFTEISVFNLTGQLLYQSLELTKFKTINADQMSGVVLVEVKSDVARITQKVVLSLE